MALTREQFGEFQGALLDAYDFPDLEMMLKFRLGEKLANLVDVARPFPFVVFQLIEKVERQGWQPTLRLINAALESRPENLKLLRFAQQLRFQATASTPELERQVREDFPFVNIDCWMAGLGRAQSRVCRVLVRGQGRVTRGTGFLVGSDVVITNHHLVAQVIGGDLPPSAVTIQLDYKFLADGVTLSNGTSYQLVQDGGGWLIDSSPPSAVDTQIEPGSALPAADELDYALLRVAGKPGDQPINPESAEPSAKERGWIDVPVGEVQIRPGDPIFIIQHPEGEPAKLALETRAVLEVNANRTRVRYTTNTETGSSGSPCFDVEWRLLALHHRGDPDMRRAAGWNEGIPFDAIVKQVNARVQRLGKSSPWGKQG